MNEEQLEVAARKMCELHNFDPDEKHKYDEGYLKRWTLYVALIKETYEVNLAIKTAQVSKPVAVQTNYNSDAKARRSTHLHNVGNMTRDALNDHVTQVHLIAEALLEYIDCIPSDVVSKLPAMPGINRDYVEKVMRGATV